MHGFCHIEIPTTDSKKSKEFYNQLFGWKINESNPDYITFSTPDNEGGGFAGKPTKEGVVLYIEVENIDKKLAEIEAAGGTTVKGKTSISPEFGFYGLFTDVCGTIMGLWAKQ